MAQLVRIGAKVNQRWSLKENLWGSNKESEEDDEDNEERSKDGQREVVEGTPLSIFYQNIVLFCILL